jgi:hypothetical protein
VYRIGQAGASPAVLLASGLNDRSLAFADGRLAAGATGNGNRRNQHDHGSQNLTHGFPFQI